VLAAPTVFFNICTPSIFIITDITKRKQLSL
jgi:hypothetical protein